MPFIPESDVKMQYSRTLQSESLNVMTS